jgi:hypothetical protein
LLTSLYRGAVAQLGERLNGIQEVVGSIPIGSTTLRSGISPELRVASHFFPVTIC